MIGWILFISAAVLGFVGLHFDGKAYKCKDNEEEKARLTKTANKIYKVAEWIGLAWVLYIAGLAWYYLCGGWLLTDVADDFSDFFWYGLLSVFVFGYLIMLLCGLFGIGPRR